MCRLADNLARDGLVGRWHHIGLGALRRHKARAADRFVLSWHFDAAKQFARRHAVDRGRGIDGATIEAITRLPCRVRSARHDLFGIGFVLRRNNDCVGTLRRHKDLFGDGFECRGNDADILGFFLDQDLFGHGFVGRRNQFDFGAFGTIDDLFGHDVRGFRCEHARIACAGIGFRRIVSRTLRERHACERRRSNRNQKHFLGHVYFPFGTLTLTRRDAPFQISDRILVCDPTSTKHIAQPVRRTIIRRLSNMRPS